MNLKCILSSVFISVFATLALAGTAWAASIHKCPAEALAKTNAVKLTKAFPHFYADHHGTPSIADDTYFQCRTSTHRDLDGKGKWKLVFDPSGCQQLSIAPQQGLVILGTGGRNHIEGTSYADVICGKGGADVIYGSNPNARNFTDDDKIYGGGGNDILVGMLGRDQIFGGGGADQLHGLEIDDVNFDGDSDDVPDDAPNQNDDDDTLYGGPGKDFIAGGPGNDKQFGENGVDQLNGGEGLDTNDGGKGKDKCVDSDNRPSDPIFGLGAGAAVNECPNPAD